MDSGQVHKIREAKHLRPFVSWSKAGHDSICLRLGLSWEHGVDFTAVDQQWSFRNRFVFLITKVTVDEPQMLDNTTHLKVLWDLEQRRMGDRDRLCVPLEGKIESDAGCKENLSCIPERDQYNSITDHRSNSQ